MNLFDNNKFCNNFSFHLGLLVFAKSAPVIVFQAQQMHQIEERQLVTILGSPSAIWQAHEDKPCPNLPDAKDPTQEVAKEALLCTSPSSGVSSF